MLTSEGLFAFRAEDCPVPTPLMASQDIRCQENYYDFYYSSENRYNLPKPLEIQPFLVDKSTASTLQSGSILLEGITPADSLPEMGVREPSPTTTPRHALQEQSPTWSPLSRTVESLVEEFDLDSGSAVQSSSLSQHFNHPSASQSVDSLGNESIGNLQEQILADFAHLHLGSSGPLQPVSYPSPTSSGVSLSPITNSATHLSVNTLPNNFPPNPSINTTKTPFPSTPPIPTPSLAIPSYTFQPIPNTTFVDASTTAVASPQFSPDPRPRCRFFMQGCCFRSNCQYSHEMPVSNPAGSHTPLPSLPIPTTTATAIMPVLPAPVVKIINTGPKAYARQLHTSVPQGPSTIPSPPTPLPALTHGSGTTPHGSKWIQSNAHYSGRKPSVDEIISSFPPIEQLVGKIYTLCQDQFGCRYLQKQLDDPNPMIRNLIFSEVVVHMSALMSDPFGNYLAQKVIACSTDYQRLRIVQAVCGDLDNISRNMHGTRAVQKLIECLVNPDEIQLVRDALRYSVVRLIQDLNGNHVIQRCLNTLSSADKQFIYDAVTEPGHLVAVATHRHGCCVLQRCIDHASEDQKLQLVLEVVSNALTLVQDPFGNYVVQYVLDLPLPGIRVAKGLAEELQGYFAELAKQKFSSNVIEKIIQSGDSDAKSLVIQEITECLDQALLQDPFANYVIQTALTYAEPSEHETLVEKINPHLILLQNTPYGKRIQAKLTVPTATATTNTNTPPSSDSISTPPTVSMTTTQQQPQQQTIRRNPNKQEFPNHR
ncbi:Armadillo-type fold [Pelomyxa schiedti]|nr:Armadillo-type fold [Pelomyxa schiedti]